MAMYKLADRCKTLIRVQLQPENALVPLLDALARVLYPLPKTTIFSSETSFYGVEVDGTLFYLLLFKVF